MEDLKIIVQGLLDRISSLESNRLKTSSSLEDIQKKIVWIAKAPDDKSMQGTRHISAHQHDCMAEIESQRAVAIKQQQTILSDKIEAIQQDLDFKIQNVQNFKVEAIDSLLSSTVKELRSELKLALDAMEALKVSSDKSISALKVDMKNHVSAAKKHTKEIEVLSSEVKTLREVVEDSKREAQFEKKQDQVRRHLVPLDVAEYKTLGSLEEFMECEDLPAWTVARWFGGLPPVDEKLYTVKQAQDMYSSVISHALQKSGQVGYGTKFFLVEFYYNTWLLRILSINRQKMSIIASDTKHVEESWDTNALRDCQKLNTLELKLCMKKGSLFKDGSGIKGIRSFHERNYIYNLVTNFIQ